MARFCAKLVLKKMIILLLLFPIMLSGESIVNKYNNHIESLHQDQYLEKIPKETEILIKPILNVAQDFKHQPHQLITPAFHENPLLSVLLLSSALGIPPVKQHGVNHYEHLPVNPYISLFLSQYGRYLPAHALGTKGIYYYAAANNYHNNKPFGSYKVYENTK